MSMEYIEQYIIYCQSYLFPIVSSGNIIDNKIHFRKVKLEDKIWNKIFKICKVGEVSVTIALTQYKINQG